MREIEADLAPLGRSAVLLDHLAGLRRHLHDIGWGNSRSRRIWSTRAGRRQYPHSRRCRSARTGGRCYVAVHRSRAPTTRQCPACQLRLIMSKTGPPLVVKDKAKSGTSKKSPVVPVGDGQTQVVVRSTWATFVPLLLGAAAAPGIPTYMRPVMASSTAPSVDIVYGIMFLLSDANQWRVAPGNTRSASGAPEIFPQHVQRSQLPRHHGRVARGPRGLTTAA
jgi:hypothetical protein